MRVSSGALILAAVACSNAFVLQPSARAVQRSPTELHFGVPGWFTPLEVDDEKGGADAAKKKKKKKDGPEKKIGLAGAVQLIAAGMGAPFLGDFEGVDKESGKFMFSLEANNLVDEDGNSKQTQMPYFENGWVDPEEEGKQFKFPWQK